MPAVLADLSIEARWIVPMTTRGRVLENHALVVRDGRILDLLPSTDAAERYAATVVAQRPAHLLMPGMINTHTHAAMSLFRGLESPAAPLEQRFLGPEFVRDGVLAAIAETASPWAKSPSEYLTEGLRVRDDYADHPLISSVFAPHAPARLSNATFARVATLADELDAGIAIDLHESADEIARSLAVHGMRPIERLWQLGLLTPALNAVHMTHATEADIDLARRSGLGVSLCSEASLKSEHQLPPLASFITSGIRLGVGTGGACRQDVWAEMRLLALMTSRLQAAGGFDYTAWDALAAATRGGAAVLGLDADVGTLESGKWADLCCVDLGGPATQPLIDPVTQLVFCGGPDIVSDVWVAGRQLLSAGELIRLDWPSVAARANAWATRLKTGG